eukprot:jgi/Mesvir1/12001/Mv00306-RA.1
MLKSVTPTAVACLAPSFLLQNKKRAFFPSPKDSALGLPRAPCVGRRYSSGTVKASSMTERAVMKAVRLERTGALDALQYVTDLPTPQVKPGYALVQIKASAINPSDLKNVMGMFKFTTLPRVPGRDFAGTVVDGPAAWVGADVWGSAPKMGFTQDGSHAQFCLVPLDCIAHLPGGLSYSQGAALGVPFGTAYAGLAAASIKPGDIVVVAGMGGVGAAALQLAKWKGAFVVGMGRGPKPSPVAPPLDGYISTSVAEPLAELTAMTPGGRGADIVFNTVGPLVFEKTLSMLAPGGRQIEISANPANPHVQLNVLDFYRRGLRLIGINTLTLTEKDYNAALQDITAGFAAKALTAPAVVEMPLSDVLGAYKAMESGGVKEKIILLP